MNNKKEELPKYIEDDDWKNEGLKAFILFIMLLIELPFIPFVYLWAWIDDIRNKFKKS